MHMRTLSAYICSTYICAMWEGGRLGWGEIPELVCAAWGRDENEVRRKTVVSHIHTS